MSAIFFALMMNDHDLSAWQQKWTEYLHQNLQHADGSHDLGHFNRVWKTARYINQKEGSPADELVLLTAAYFHDFVSYPKNHPLRSQSSRDSAEKTGEILATEFPDFPADKIAAVQHAIHAHSYSAQVEPKTWEAKILQDADRMEALGAIGLARTFYVSGLNQGSLFHADDPLAQTRELNDSLYALDHFENKLLKLPALMNTATGRHLAQENAEYLRQFLKKIAVEIQGLSPQN